MAMFLIAFYLQRKLLAKFNPKRKKLFESISSIAIVIIIFSIGLLPGFFSVASCQDSKTKETMQNILIKVEKELFGIDTNISILRSKEINMEDGLRTCEIKAKLSNGPVIPATFTIKNTGFNKYEVRLVSNR